MSVLQRGDLQSIPSWPCLQQRLAGSGPQVRAGQPQPKRLVEGGKRESQPGKEEGEEILEKGMGGFGRVRGILGRAGGTGHNLEM